VLLAGGRAGGRGQGGRGGGYLGDQLAGGQQQVAAAAAGRRERLSLLGEGALPSSGTARSTAAWGGWG
jgi:hypothetical protein